MTRLGENCYGKSRVRLSRITRHGDHHDFNEWTVQVLLEGDFETAFTEADNSKILPTDTMKNTVYSVARGSKAATIEEFAMELGDYLLANNPQVSGACVTIHEKCWERMIVDGAPEPTTFKYGGPEMQTVRVVCFHRIYQGQADHAEASDRPHLWHPRDGHLGLCIGCDRLRAGAYADCCLVAERICRASQHERAAHVV